jgi:HK97 family phage major capsid protein
MTPEEIVKQATEEMKKAFEDFKTIHAKELAEVKAKGDSAGDIKEQLAKANAAIDVAEKKQQKALDEIEKKLNRLELGGKGLGEEPEAKAKRERKAAFFKSLRIRPEQKLSDEEQKVLVVSSDPAGGSLAPPEYVQEIIKAVVLVSPMRGIVNVRSTSAGEVQIPKRTQTAAATRTGEISTRAETQNPQWGLMKIPAPEMYAEARITWADLEDSAFDLEGLLTQEFAEQFGVKEGQEVISGNGVGQILGFLDANAAGPSTPIAYTPSGQAATIAGAAAGSAGQGDPLVTLFHAVKTAYANNGRWVLNRKSLGKVRMFKDTTGQYLWQPGVGQSGTLMQGLAPTILGAPYTEAPDMPDEAANAFPIAFGDWKRAFTIVDRIDMAVTRDPYTLASSGQVKIFARRRVGGQVVLGEALMLLKCATS